MATKLDGEEDDVACQEYVSGSRAGRQASQERVVLIVSSLMSLLDVPAAAKFEVLSGEASLSGARL